MSEQASKRRTTVGADCHEVGPQGVAGHHIDFGHLLGASWQQALQAGQLRHLQPPCTRAPATHAPHRTVVTVAGDGRCLDDSDNQLLVAMAKVGALSNTT